MNKKETLEEIIKCLENLNNNIGEIITEYHWREFCSLIEMLKDNFPEYNLKEFQNILFEDKISKLKLNNKLINNIDNNW